MATTPSNLSELTVTCRQCGSASLARIGDREYRCNHCGAITVVSQDGSRSAPPAAYMPAAGYVPPNTPRAQSASFAVATTTIPVLSPGQQADADRAAAQRRRKALFGWLVILGIIFLIVHSYTGSSSSSPGSSGSMGSAAADATVSASLLTVSPTNWSLDPDGLSGQYTGLITNRSSYPVDVPRFSMRLFLRGTQVDSADSTVPLTTLLPGEYEPIAFPFRTPSDDPHPEITPPPTANRAEGKVVKLQLTDRQLVREEGVAGYRLIGVVNNTTRTPARDISVIVMLFDSAHTVTGYGSYKVNRALRPGERTAIEIKLPTTNVNPVASYEYLIDASPEAS